MFTKEQIQENITQLQAKMKQLEADYNAHIGAIQVYNEMLLKIEKESKVEEVVTE